MQENVNATGKLKMTLVDTKTGQVKETRDVKNLVVNVGKAFIASRMMGNSATPMSHMAIGTSVIPPMLTDVALGAQNGRVAFDSSSVASRTASFVATFPAGTGTGALVEAGIFNASTSGTMLCRTSFDVFNKAADDLLVIEWDVTIN